MTERPETDAISSESRQEWIFNHKISVNIGRWNENLNLRSLGGGPVRARESGGSETSSGIGFISRGDLFALGIEADKSDDYALRLLWHTIAWGVGRRFRLCKKRMDSVMRNPECADTLAEAARLARTDCGAAYDLMCPQGGQNLIGYLGPSFATKYLYFAGGGSEVHPSLILDDVVSSALERRGFPIPVSYGKWSTEGYIRYCQLLANWADERSSEVDRRVGADEYERLLFSSPKRLIDKFDRSSLR